jgi:hypothetical protein
MILLATAALVLAGCLEVDGPKVLASDLARADPAFSALPPGTVFGFTPAPGARRILDAAAVKRLAAPAELALDAAARFCVVRATAPLSAERVMEAMRASLGDPAARIEIDGLSGFPAPRGAAGPRAPACRGSPPPGRRR